MANIADIKTNEPVHWGREQEELLQGLLQTKARFEQECVAPMSEYILTNCKWPPMMRQENKEAMSRNLARFLISKAGTIRDLLKPFDDGTRPTQTQLNKD